MPDHIKCLLCGACCTAYDISTLAKPAGVSCPYLGEDRRCTDYGHRPAVCRAFQADELCVLISTLPYQEKVAVLQMVYYDDTE